MMLVISCCIVAGMAFPEQLSPLRRYAAYFMATMTFVNCLSGGFKDLGRIILHPLPALTVLVLLHLVLPALVAVVGKLVFSQQQDFLSGIILAYTLPTAVTSLIWTGIAGGNIQLVLSLVLLDTVLAPFIIPFSLRYLAGTVVELNTISMMKNLLVMTALPAATAMAIYDFSAGRAKQTIKPWLDPLGKIAMVLICTANVTGCAPFIRHMSFDLAMILVGMLLFCWLGYLVGYLCGRLLRVPRETTVAMVYGVGMRNVSMGSVLASAYFPPEAMYPVAFAPIISQITASIVSTIVKHREKKVALQSDK